jgi:hypothetical protein
LGLFTYLCVGVRLGVTTPVNARKLASAAFGIVIGTENPKSKAFRVNPQSDQAHNVISFVKVLRMLTPLLFFVIVFLYSSYFVAAQLSRSTDTHEPLNYNEYLPEDIQPLLDLYGTPNGKVCISHCSLDSLTC